MSLLNGGNGGPGRAIVIHGGRSLISSLSAMDGVHRCLGSATAFTPPSLNPSVRLLFGYAHGAPCRWLPGSDLPERPSPRRIVAEHRRFLQEKWREIHGR